MFAESVRMSEWGGTEIAAAYPTNFSFLSVLAGARRVVISLTLQVAVALPLSIPSLPVIHEFCTTLTQSFRRR